jgi:hypothetical protein
MRDESEKKQAARQLIAREARYGGKDQLLLIPSNGGLETGGCGTHE